MSVLVSRMAASASTICRSWILRRADGLTLGFSDHDADLRVDGVNCRASAGLQGGAFAAAAGLSVNTGTVSGALTDDALSEADFIAGRWDGALVERYLVDWSDGTSKLTFRGTLGELRQEDGAFHAELLGQSAMLNAVRGRVYQAGCDAMLGDARCGVDLTIADRHVSGRVVEIGSGHVDVALDDAAFARDSGWFEHGRAVGVGGVADGLHGRIEGDLQSGPLRRVGITWASAISPDIGDGLTLEVGCDRTLATCRDKFENRLNFRGCPHIPGADWLMSPAREGAG